MVSIAICDDEAQALDRAEKAVRSFGAPLTVDKYLSSQKLCEEVESGKLFDIFLLDVEMPEPNGLKTAERVRSACPGASIIFLTSHTEFPYVQESFKVGALRYVCKPDLETVLPEALQAALSVYRDNEGKFLTLTWRGSGVRIPYGDISVIRRTARTLEIVTNSQGTLYDSRSLSDMMTVLSDRRFLYTNRSTIVNLDHVRRLSKSGVVLKSGEEIKISRMMMNEVKSTILRVWGQAT